MLEHGWQSQRFPECREWLVDGYARTSGGYLEEGIARFAEVDGAVVETLDDRCWCGNGGDPSLPGLDVPILGCPRNMVDCPCAAATGTGHFVVGDE